MAKFREFINNHNNKLITINKAHVVTVCEDQYGHGLAEITLINHKSNDGIVLKHSYHDVLAWLIEDDSYGKIW